MNQERIDYMIPIALKTLYEMQVEEKGMKCGDYTIGKVYFGYVAAFGPSVVQSGIAKTLAFYAKDKGEGEGDRKYILEFIMKVFQDAYPVYSNHTVNNLLHLYTEEIKKDGFTTLQRLALADKILEAAIACKLAMNTYHAQENKRQGEDK
jgi:hypothetical protein